MAVAVQKLKLLVARQHSSVRVEAGLRAGVCRPAGGHRQRLARRRGTLLALLDHVRRRLPRGVDRGGCRRLRSEEHTSELQSLMRTSYAVFCFKKKIINCTSTDPITTSST